MSEEIEKLEKLSKAVNEEVDGQIKDILAEAEASRQQIIEKANDESLNYAYGRIKDEIKKIAAKYVKIISKAELDSKREILIYREQISNKIIENVKISIDRFTKSKDYKDYLIKLAKDEIVQAPKSSEIVVFLSKNDMQYSGELKSVLGEKISFEEKSGIKLGGLCVLYKNDNVLKDRTLDSALKEQKDLFNNSSSLRLN